MRTPTVTPFDLTLSSTPRGARLARLLAVDQLHAWGLPQEMIDRAELIAAELASNAVLHAPTPAPDFRLRLTLCSPTPVLRIEVIDAGGPYVPHSPTAAPPDAESGRGLLLVAALSTGWGVTLHAPRTKSVWATLAPAPPPP